ncbi:MAG: hypothetical protein RBU25_09440, partial [Lentisphaeria bacterium]|nr:hypothetical protein [Lentisphaeria bacterium]
MTRNDGSSRVRAEEMALMGGWLGELLGTAAPSGERHGTEAPFSFRCGDRSSRDWLRLGDAARTSGNWADGRRVHELRWQDAANGLRCVLELTEFADFPAIEWVVRLRNDGAADTPPIHDFAALDTVWRCPGPGIVPELRRSLGSDGRHDDFQYEVRELRQSMWSVPCTVR